MAPKFITNRYKSIKLQVQKRPIISFTASMIVLFVLIAISAYIQKPIENEQANTVNPKQVHTYNIGSASYITIPATIEKTNVTTIQAQTNGIITDISVTAGDQTNKYAPLIRISQTYTGGNTSSVSRQIAQTNYQNLQDTYGDQIEIIDRQKEVANLNEANAEDLRDIARGAKQDAEDLLDQNQRLLDSITPNINELDPETQTTEFTTALQYQATINSLRNSIRNNQLAADDDRPPKALAEQQRLITHKQLELQQNALDLQLELSSLQLQLAQIQEALYRPTSPFSGTIQQVHVRVGQTVSPGTKLITIAGDNTQLKITAYANADIAANLSRIEPSQINLGQQTITAIPTYISSEATNGQLYSITYDIDDLFLPPSAGKGYDSTSLSLARQITDGQAITIQAPIGLPDTGTTIPLIPIDAIFQTPTSTTVYIIDNDKAKSVPITLGQVHGSLVEVLSGLQPQDQIITSRNVINGDTITISSNATQ